ncbi:hypothetical protein [Erwinia psidii]|uniref:Uncharacterized protein n=1 Tax=Erwinia psidii TaxID=69224 RepID=A0A3N6V0X5_9GAMM|nr:hypothetical protein [Erwinia psidii]MCX8961381.1 hypothetical protein [Erwinia psidii]MCX8963773.1 hypothetical protein [Erwinia psidii]RQM38715.1 hypothetical protein EB241_08495 [Erwinia psidii]
MLIKMLKAASVLFMVSCYVRITDFDVLPSGGIYFPCGKVRQNGQDKEIFTSPVFRWSNPACCKNTFLNFQQHLLQGRMGADDKSCYVNITSSQQTDRINDIH